MAAQDTTGNKGTKHFRTVHFNEDERQMFSKSWEISLKTKNRLLKNVIELIPLDTKKTLRLNEARTNIPILHKLMAEMIQVIDNNKRVVEAEIESIQVELDKFKGLRDCQLLGNHIRGGKGVLQISR